MTHPYRDRPDYAYWRQAITETEMSDVDPIVAPVFRIGKHDPVATAGSCFAQHISRSLQRQGFCYLVTEAVPPGQEIEAESYGVFTARYGNIYTVRQLLQLFDRAYGVFRPEEKAWKLPSGVWVDPFRPRISKTGFADPEAVAADRARHLSQVRSMFETCSVFVFTLGLTEGWMNVSDGAVYPLAPGAIFDCDDSRYRFVNFRVGEMVTDLTGFIDKLRLVNPGVRIVLTVSPVPLIATGEDRHVLVSNTYSKGALRAVAEEGAASREAVAYFPSYEIIAGPQSASRYFAADLRSVTDDGVAHVMRVFSRHYLTDAAPRSAAAFPRARTLSAEERAAASRRFEAVSEVMCDEESLVQGR